jgi:hypothetical protein
MRLQSLSLSGVTFVLLTALLPRPRPPGSYVKLLTLSLVLLPTAARVIVVISARLEVTVAAKENVPHVFSA